MKFNCPYWKSKARIDLLQKWILVHSFLYYELNESIVSDEMFDNNCLQLYKFKVKYKQSYRKSNYYYAMKNFDGSTGFGYFEKLNKENSYSVMRDANYAKMLVEKRRVSIG